VESSADQISAEASTVEVLSKGVGATKTGKRNGSRLVYLNVFKFRTCFQIEFSFTEGCMKKLDKWDAIPRQH
jgi:hypothetical protein